MEKNGGKWKVILGSEWDGAVFVFDTAKDAADFAQRAADSQNNIFQEYGSRKMCSIIIDYMTDKRCADLLAEFEKEQEEN